MKSSKITINKTIIEEILLKEVCEKFGIQSDDVAEYGFKYSDEFFVEFGVVKETPIKEVAA